MLLNISNHPSDKWFEEQYQTAIQAYGGIIDLPFPNVPPEATSDQVGRLANEYFEKVTATQPTAVHLMGEMTFTHALVQKLKAAGIPCVASTSERMVVEGADGEKTVRFRFVQFRAY